MKTSPLDITLYQGRLQFHALVEIVQSRRGIAFQVREGGSHVESQGLEITQVAQLEGLLKRRGSLFIAIPGLLGHCKEALAQLALAAVLAQISRFIQALGERLGTEALEVVGNKCRAWELLALGGQDGLALLFRNLLQQSLQGDTAGLVAEAIDDAACSEIKKGLAELFKMLICDGPAIQGLDVLTVHGNCGAGVLDDLLPLGQDVIASSTVGVVDRVRLADNSFSVEINSLIIILGTKCLVSSRLEFRRIGFSSLYWKTKKKKKISNANEKTLHRTQRTSSDNCPTVASSTSGSSSDGSSAFFAVDSRK